VKEVCGEEGVSLCRCLLDGSGGEYMQNITEGRCVVCNGSTFEDDMQAQAAQLERGQVDLGAEEVKESMEVEVILCDGCNAGK
jgi:hypothetical protein